MLFRSDGGPKRIGPFHLENSPNTPALSLGIVAIYVLTLLFAAFLGPCTLLSTLWRMSALLSFYALFSRLCGWDSVEEGSEGDVLLAPALCAIKAMGNELGKIVRWYTEWKVQAQVKALREAIGDGEVRVELRG